MFSIFAEEKGPVNWFSCFFVLFFNYYISVSPFYCNIYYLCSTTSGQNVLFFKTWNWSLVVEWRYFLVWIANKCVEVRTVLVPIQSNECSKHPLPKFIDESYRCMLGYLPSLEVGMLQLLDCISFVYEYHSYFVNFLSYYCCLV